MRFCIPMYGEQESDCLQIFVVFLTCEKGPGCVCFEAVQNMGILLKRNSLNFHLSFCGNQVLQVDTPIHYTGQTCDLYWNYLIMEAQVQNSHDKVKFIYQFFAPLL